MRLIAVVLLAVSLTACGSDNATPSSESSGGAGPDAPANEPAPKRTSDTAYNDAKELCGAVTIKQLASEYGGDPSSPASVADAYAKQSYRGAFQASARDGCLAGLGAP